THDQAYVRTLAEQRDDAGRLHDHVHETDPRRMHDGTSVLLDLAIDFDTHEAPSLGPICTMLHGIVASEVVNLLTGVRPVRGVPFYAQFDMRTLQFKTGQARWGNDGPIQRVKTAYVTRRLGQGARERAKTG
uniref:hypothetical protein n=1 Tax=Phycicoccus elongatus TaxID=101689 RepID=UPI003784D15C